MAEENRKNQTQVQLPNWDARREAHRGGNKSAQSKKRMPNFLRHRNVSSNKGPHKHGIIFLFFGVVLPLIAIVFELTTHFCAQHFFDPFPSASHVILFLLIPLSNFMAWLAGRRDMSAHFGFMSLISGMAMGIGCLYALMFLPLTPHSAMYTLLFGFGLLGFAPLFSVPCTWLSGKTVCKLAASRKTFFDPHQVEHIGHLFVLCLVVAVELPSTLTRMNLSLAADPGTEKQGVQWLRQFGSEEVMLRACYERSGRATDILGSLYESGHPLSIESARSIFYKVTGKPFNSVAIPAAARATIQHAGLVDDPNGFNAGVKDEFDLDSDIAGENVSGVARGLSVSDSSVNVNVEPNSAVADLDWSATFTNVSPYDREARAKLILPSDGVVTKATVTVNGVERDATILVRSLARSIYKQSVVDRKDPLLVSTCAVNQILIQCFPVQPNSSMIVRLKIAAPLILSADKASGALMLPAFEERNFQFEQPVHVTAISDESIEAPVSKSVTEAPVSKTINEPASKIIEQNNSKHLMLHRTAFDVEPSQIARFGAVVRFARDHNISEVTMDPSAGNTGISARVVVPTYKRPDNLTILIDGSAPMQRYIPELAVALKTLPSAVKANIVVVGDDVEDLGSNENPAKYAIALSALEKYRAVGGHADDAQLLNRIASSPVLWIHGAQPMSSADTKMLNALLQRKTNTPWLYDLQTVSGPNELLSGLEPNSNFVSVPRVGKLNEDLNRLFSSWMAVAPKASDNVRFADWTPAVASADVTKAVASKPGTAKPDLAKTGSPITDKSTEHTMHLGGRAIPALVQLFGYQKLLESYQSANKGPALMLAEKYHLVSPISSAVVMEYVPASHPSPMQLGVKSSEKVSWLSDKLMELKNVKAPEESFKSMVMQLNNLSTAAGPDANYKSDWSGAPVGGDATTNAVERTDEPVLQGATNGTVGSRDASQLLDKKEAATKTMAKQSSAEEETPLYAQMPSPVASPVPAEPMPMYSKAPPAMTSVPAAPAAPNSSSSSWADSFSVQPQKEKSMSSAPGYAGGGLVGAPVDPRYGQSNEVGQMYDAQKPFSDLASAFSIFAMVFMAMFAFLKLLKAMAASKSHK